MDQFELPAKSVGADKRGLERFGLVEDAWMIVAAGIVVSVICILVIVRPPYLLTILVSLMPAAGSGGYAWFFFRSDRPPRFHQDWWADQFSNCAEEYPAARRRRMAENHPTKVVGRGNKHESFARRLFRR